MSRHVSLYPGLYRYAQVYIAVPTGEVIIKAY